MFINQGKSSAPNANAKGVVKALDFLTASNRKSFGDAVPEFDDGALNAMGKRVVVIGGGDTAMDCVRTSIRQGATSVKCLYRRDRANMPGSQREVQNAEEEGVVFEWLSAPKGFAETGGNVTGVMVQKMRLGAPDATGRQAPEVIEGADYVEDADIVIMALGFEPEDLPTLWGEPDLPVSRWGTICDRIRHGKTAMDGCLCGRRHRARRVIGGLGNQGWPRLCPSDFGRAKATKTMAAE